MLKNKLEEKNVGCMIGVYVDISVKKLVFILVCPFPSKELQVRDCQNEIKLALVCFIKWKCTKNLYLKRSAFYIMLLHLKLKINCHEF